MGNFLESPVREKETNAGADIARALWYAVASMQGWRAAMEDAHIATLTPEGFPSDTALFAVFDGHGGTLAAQLASEELVRVLAVKLDQSGAFKDGQLANPKLAEDAMREAFLELDREIRRIMNECYGKDLSGCTAVAALVTKTHIIVANAGDSRCVLAKGGATIEMSYDHKPANPGERARIEKAGGTVRSNRVNGDLAVSRGLGDFGYKDKPELDEVEQKVSPEPDVKIQKIDGSEEFLVLACDGVWDVVTNDELCAYVRKLMRNGEKDMQKIAEELVDFSLDAGSRDNMSVILVKLHKLPEGVGPGVQPIREERKRREEAEKTAS